MAEIIQARTAPQIEQARALFLEYGASLGFSLCFQSFDQELAALPGDYAPPSGRLLLAEVDAKPAGCVALRVRGNNGEGACEMKRLYVRPGFRGQQLGRRLVEDAVRAARGLG